MVITGIFEYPQYKQCWNVFSYKKRRSKWYLAVSMPKEPPWYLAEYSSLILRTVQIGSGKISAFLKYQIDKTMSY